MSKLSKLGRVVHTLSGGIAVFAILGIVGTMDYQAAVRSTEGVSSTAIAILLISAAVFTYTDWLNRN